jgi:hypothetical protein
VPQKPDTPCCRHVRCSALQHSALAADGAGVDGCGGPRCEKARLEEEDDSLLSIELRLLEELGTDSPYTRERAILLRTAAGKGAGGGGAEGKGSWCTLAVVLDVDLKKGTMVVQADPARPVPRGCGPMEVVPICTVTSHRRNFEALHRTRELEGTAVSSLQPLPRERERERENL